MLGFWWVDPLHSMLLLWNECGEDFTVFCYRISSGALVIVHQHAIDAAPQSLRMPRKRAACSTGFASSSTNFTTSRE